MKDARGTNRPDSISGSTARAAAVHRANGRAPAAATVDATGPRGEPDSKALVLDTAQRLILEHGFTGLSMRELARHSGVAKGTIYHHFQDKRQIYLHVLERDILVVRDHLLEIVEQEGAFAAKLRALVEMYFTLQRERRLVIMSALRESAVLDTEFSEILKKYRSELLQPIGALVSEGIANQEVRAVNVELTVLSLLGTLQGFVVHRLILEDADIDDTVIEHIVTTFAQGIMTTGAASHAFPASGSGEPTDIGPSSIAPSSISSSVAPSSIAPSSEQATETSQ